MGWQLQGCGLLPLLRAVDGSAGWSGQTWRRSAAETRTAFRWQSLVLTDGHQLAAELYTARRGNILSGL